MNHIFYMYFNTSISDRDKDLCMPFLPEERILRVNRYKSREASLKCMLTGLFLRYGIEMLGYTIELEDMKVEANGKPYIKGNPFYYNLSHSKDVIALMISDSPCGIDIQERVPAKENLARRILHENEYTLFQQATSPSEQSKLLTGFWCGKESYVKLTGTGIACKLSAIDVSECMLNNITVMTDGDILSELSMEPIYVSGLSTYMVLDSFIPDYYLGVCKRDVFKLDSIREISQDDMISWFLCK